MQFHPVNPADCSTFGDIVLELATRCNGLKIRPYKNEFVLESRIGEKNFSVRVAPHELREITKHGEKARQHFIDNYMTARARILRGRKAAA